MDIKVKEIPKMVEDQLAKGELVERRFKLNSVFWSNADVYATPNRLIVKRGKKIEIIDNNQIANITLVHKRYLLAGFICLIITLMLGFLGFYFALGAAIASSSNIVPSMLFVFLACATFALAVLAFMGFKYIEINLIGQPKPYSLYGIQPELESISQYIKDSQQ